MPKSTGPSRKNNQERYAKKRANAIQRRADEEFYDEEYDEYDYERSVKFANRGCLIAFALVIAAMAVVLLMAFLFVSGEINGNNATATGPVTVDVLPGSGGTIIGDLLKENGLIGNDAIFRFYVRFNGAGGQFQVGRYELTPGMSYDEIITALSQEPPPRDTVDVTFVDGNTVIQFATAVEKAGICTAQEFLDAANDVEQFQDIKFFQYLDYDANTFMKAEGYMAPNTYNFYTDETPHNVARKLYEQFDKELSEMNFVTPDGEKDFYQMLEYRGMSLREAITLASMVEEEASLPNEHQARVAGVFWNRLKNDLPSDLPRRTLGSDVTLRYLADWVSRDYEHPDYTDWLLDDIKASLIQILPHDVYYAYYTGDEDPETREGLPASPISNPSTTAILAAMQPEVHDYYFFVNDLYGEFYYARTYNEHLRNVNTAGGQNAKKQQEDAAAGDA